MGNIKVKHEEERKLITTWIKKQKKVLPQINNKGVSSINEEVQRLLWHAYNRYEL